MSHHVGSSGKGAESRARREVSRSAQRTLDTEEWHLACFMEWKPKKEPYDIQCPSCHGRGAIGGHFKDLDGPRTCDQCSGSGQITHPGPSTPKPELPKELIEHLRKAWREFVIASAARDQASAESDSPLSGA